MYLLGRHMGLSAQEVMVERPAWEIDLLLEGLRAETQPGPLAEDDDVPAPASPRGDPWAAEPPAI